MSRAGLLKRGLSLGERREIEAKGPNAHAGIVTARRGRDKCAKVVDVWTSYAVPRPRFGSAVQPAGQA
jgi:hypothetical protein